jgi:Protein of unknown function (DUF3429)
MIGPVPRGGDRIPAAAALLGAAGLIPFVAGAVLVWLMPSLSGIPVGRVVIVYGAVILSFLGGMIWGLAAAGLAQDSDDPSASSVLAVSVLPSLAAWVLVFMPQHIALWGLALAFALFLFVDRWAGTIDLTPAWWLTLRTRLTAVVVLSLLAAAAETYAR